MKKRILILSLLFVLVSGLSYSQTLTSSGQETIGFSEKKYDFGKIPMGRPVTHIFTLTNNGKDSLYLENVTASCGCTTPVWKKNAVAPGASTEIEVGYNAAAEGYFEKPVTIYYNRGSVTQLSVKGTVYMRNATPVPANTSISALKQMNWK